MMVLRSIPVAINAKEIRAGRTSVYHYMHLRETLALSPAVRGYK